MPFVQSGAMADADDRCIFHVGQHFIERILSFFIDGARRFVKEYPFRFSEEYADKSQFLLFSQG